LVNVPVIVATPLDCDRPPVNPVPVGTVHVYVVPAGTIPFVPLVGLVLKAIPPQILVLIGVTLAVGLMVATNVNVVPTPQLTVFGVTI
jgi:hypothetical protein